MRIPPIGVGLQVCWERRDLTPVGGGRLLRPIEARQQVAAQIFRSLQLAPVANTEPLRPRRSVLYAPQRSLSLPAVRSTSASRHNVRRLSPPR